MGFVDKRAKGRERSDVFVDWGFFCSRRYLNRLFLLQGWPQLAVNLDLATAP